VTANTIIAPNNGLVADKLIEDTATGAHEISQSISLTVGVVHAMSIYAKAGERSRVRLAGRQAANWSVLPSGIFDLLTGTVVSSTGAQNAEIVSVGNGWYRCTVFGSPSSSGVGMLVGLVQSGTISSYTGDGVSGLHIWGSQTETGSFPTSIIPTTTIAQARTVDGVSRIVPASREGTIICICQGVGPASGRQQAAFTLSDGTQANRVLIRRNAGLSGTQYAVVANDSESAGSTTSQKVANQRNVFVISWKENQFLGAEDGVIVFTDNSGAAPLNLTQLGIGSAGPGGSENLNGTIELIAMIPRALTAAELQQVKL
jgi:hypothetical protein